ncbi:MAG: RluA family pseudouridine synthase [Firmicutes bacterium HGW-Firmicutes-16]|nr:MAG: RluA family pseudouridine synthase [Firmicutes bacterium HGW-Firmicutes-16]
MERILQLRAEGRHFGRTLKQIMQKEYGMSSGLISRMKQSDNSVLVNGAPQWVNYIASEGDEITFTVETEDMSSEGIIPTTHPVDIIFEDEDILVVNKPAYLPCHPVTSNRENTLSNYLTAYYLQTGQAFTARVINRLDSNTSGLVLFAKNALAGGTLNELSKRKLIIKEYTAITLGIPSQEGGEVSTHIRRKEGNALAREVCSDEDGKMAITQYEVLSCDKEKNLALLRVRTLTGRTHQIRVHMANIGCPLAGDFLYGTEDHELIARHALHMGELSLNHPLTKAPLHFSAPLPEDMQRLFPV